MIGNGSGVFREIGACCDVDGISIEIAFAAFTAGSSYTCGVTIGF